jgi:hypothetical protein
MLTPHAYFLNFALLDGRRITPTTRSRRNSAGSSLIQIRYKELPFAGEIRRIIRHRQPGVDGSANILLVSIVWMKMSKETPLDEDTLIWKDL